MAKSPNNTKKENETVNENKKPDAPATPEAPKPIVPVTPEAVAERLSIAVYNPNQVTEFGNKFLISLVKQAAMEQQAQEMLSQAGEAKQYLGFEMLHAVMDIYDKHKEGKDAVDIYAIFSDKNTDTEKLNNRVLLHMGVLRKEVTEDDTVKWVWTDPDAEKLYNYTKELKEENEGEYNRRLANRKRLNIRLSDAYKAACYLNDNKLSAADLYYSEDDTKRLVPTIRNAPKAIGGEAGTIQMNTRKVAKGADLSPTMSSLTKLATDKHKGTKADRTDKGETRSGEAKLGMTDEAFGEIVNTLRRAINAQEGTFTEEMQKQLVNLASYINTTVSSFAKSEAA